MSGAHVPRHGGRLRAVAAMVGLMACLFPAGAVGRVSGSARAAVPTLAWQPCAGADQVGFQCATATVPLDYGNPRGTAIEIAVIRHRATDSRHRIGSLFFNPGGPGGAGTEDLPAWFDHFPAELRARFDLVSFDPRGIGESTAVRCFATKADEAAFLAGAPLGFPVGTAEETAWIKTWRGFGQHCRRRNPRLLNHMSTAEVARDLDGLRRAVGDQALSYIGVSYGTLLGATYANVFPDRVRAMTLDGNVDPDAWFNRGKQRAVLSTSLRLGSDEGSSATLGRYLDLCGEATTAHCAFSAGSAAATHAKFATLLQRLRIRPVTIAGTKITAALLLSEISGVLFSVDPVPPDLPGWTFGANLLQAVWTASDPDASSSGRNPAPVSAPASEAPSTQPTARYTGDNQGDAVQCAESPNPHDPNAFRLLADLARVRSGEVGAYWSWGDEVCSTWPATAVDRYPGPWNRATAAPILVLGNTFDPSTAYQASVNMTHELARARLLTVEGYGHTALLNPSTCAKAYESRYFVDGTLPPRGTVCPQDAQPFTTSASP